MQHSPEKIANTLRLVQQHYREDAIELEELLKKAVSRAPLYNQMSVVDQILAAGFRKRRLEIK